MYVFGVNLPVVEILFIVVVLFVLALIVIIVQLYKMSRHIDILDDTTLQIRRHDEAQMMMVQRFTLQGLSDSDIVDLRDKVLPAAERATMAVAQRLLSGEDPEAVKHYLMERGLTEVVATRLVNTVSFYVKEFGEMTPVAMKQQLTALKNAAK